MTAECGVDNALNGFGCFGCKPPYVHGERVSLSIQERAVDFGKSLPQFLLDTAQVGQKSSSVFTANVRTPDVKSVTARIDEIVDANQLLHVGAVAPADDSHRPATRQRLEGAADGLRQHGQVRPRDNGGQRAVVVQKEDGAFTLRLKREVGNSSKRRW